MNHRKSLNHRKGENKGDLADAGRHSSQKLEGSWCEEARVRWFGKAESVAPLPRMS